MAILNRVPTGVLVASFLPAVLLGGCTVQHRSAWEPVAACVDYAQMQPHVHVVRTDLHCPEVRLEVTPEGQRGQTTSGYARESGVTVAVNANFFQMDTLVPRGDVVAGGVAWRQVSKADGLPRLVCDRSKRCEISVVSERGDGISEMKPDIEVTGLQFYRDGGFHCSPGAPAACAGSNASEKNPRTLAGLSLDGRWLYLLVLEGRQRSFSGFTLAESAGLLADLRIDAGLNLDGGGSSTLVINGRRVNALPVKQAAERPVANQLGIRTMRVQP